VKIDVLTLFPEIFRGYLEASILGKAGQRGLLSLNLVNIRDYALDKHRTCDDAPYGGGAGMVLKPEPLAAALEAVGAPAGAPAGRAAEHNGALDGARVVYLTPSGRIFDQGVAEELAGKEKLVLVCGRYEGIDQRIIETFVTDEISIGDYVLSGGEVAAMVVIDAVARLVKGVIKEDSLEEESFAGGLLEYPHYTRPEEFRGLRVPDILLSGHHAEIARWRLRKSVEKTARYRPELLKGKEFSADIRDYLELLQEEGEANGYHKSD
jgi:tRNA (guanine37-N1)-methyltransferase